MFHYIYSANRTFLRNFPGISNNVPRPVYKPMLIWASRTHFESFFTFRSFTKSSPFWFDQFKFANIG